jgi:hypothetical protein
MIEEVTIIDQQQKVSMLFYITKQGDRFHVWDSDENPVNGIVAQYIRSKYLQAKVLIFII